MGRCCVAGSSGGGDDCDNGEERCLEYDLAGGVWMFESELRGEMFSLLDRCDMGSCFTRPFMAEVLRAALASVSVCSS